MIDLGECLIELGKHVQDCPGCNEDSFCQTGDDIIATYQIFTIEVIV